MVVLKNILRNNNLIEADYYPENETESGHIVIDYLSGSVIDFSKAPLDQIGMYAFHAKRKLLRLADLEIIPNESKEIWY